MSTPQVSGDGSVLSVSVADDFEGGSAMMAACFKIALNNLQREAVITPEQHLAIIARVSAEVDTAIEQLFPVEAQQAAA